jgi:hypothetical protein
MGGTVSSIAGYSAGSLKFLVRKAGLPLQIDDDVSSEDLKNPGQAPPPSQYTKPYQAPGFFTGVRSAIQIPATPNAVYNSLASDLHHIFTPMTECHDEVQEDDGAGRQKIFRVVRIPFKVAFVSGNLKLRLHVVQCRQTGKIHFESAKEGRLIRKLEATFDITPMQGDPEQAQVNLDAKIDAVRLPPPPFKSLVKGIMVHKIDMCMLDLLAYHTGDKRTDSAMGLQQATSRKRNSASFEDARSSLDIENPELLTPIKRTKSVKLTSHPIIPEEEPISPV